ncbi:MAG: arylsulfatase [Candidatus Altiarchaeales archaeon WOR_SM1_79]|nr:MAG: arylsulfatase [Candidatus Altiarchaeales archaeon WOR_SM1_79]
MKRREFLKTFGIGTTALAFPHLLCSKNSQVKTFLKPNIIFILADDLGYNELGCYGQKIIRTPNIDRIAAEGKRFTQSYSGSPVCAPSRCVLMTGKHTGHSYIRNNGNPPGRVLDEDKMLFPGQNPIPDETITIAEILKGGGYATGAIGKWGLGYEGSSGDPNKQGFDLFFGYICQVHAHNHYPRFFWKNGERIMLEGNNRTLTGKQYSQDLFIREALQFIRENNDKPFFLYLPFIIPHLSIQVPEETLNEYKGKIPEAPYEHTSYLKHPFPRAGYAAMITYMDKGIGMIWDLIKELGIDENTLIFFSSDNGPAYDRLGGTDSEFFNSAGSLRGLKGSLYEGGIRVPMIARWPNHIKPGTVTDHVTAFGDILPTLCEITGTHAPSDIDGVSFTSTLFDSGKQIEHKYLYWEFPAYGGQQAVRMGDWKGVRQNMFKGNMNTELFNLKDDIGEKNNVANKYPEIVKKIEQIMREARVPSEMFKFKQLDEQK